MIKQETARLPVRIPESLSIELMRATVESSLSLKGKSKWLCDAIGSLLDDPMHQDIIELDNALSASLKAEMFTVPIEIKDRLKKVLVSLKKQFPEKNLTVSSIVRAAIIRQMSIEVQ